MSDCPEQMGQFEPRFKVETDFDLDPRMHIEGESVPRAAR
jgi:hypothetical protein